MEKIEKLKSGIVVFQDPEFWLKVESMQLNYKIQGIRITKADLAAKLMQIGYQAEIKELLKEVKE